ncbi:BrnT family toxin [Pelotalea chapellei]|uniref:BrnT family toxin n=1 Tax=Pelotalea chapellei TaxID=44671 RepID=A0ABS5UB70_9BACT|nr:BrnT family toxin [Pelotalea chapellei]
MKITWDSTKAASNPKNHDGVTFDEAQHVLLDPFALTREDSDSGNEQRYVTLGVCRT